MTNQELLKRRQEAVPQGIANAAPIFICDAKGAVLTDIEGREYIDFAGGIGVNNVGHCHPQVVEAIRDQAGHYIHTCFGVAMYEPFVELAEKLNRLTPGDFEKMTMFVNSGTEAVENAIKIARYENNRQAIFCLDNAFHGRSQLGMTLTAKVKPYSYGFGPAAPEVYRMPSAYCYRCPLGLKHPACDCACADYLEEVCNSNIAPESVAAVIAEPIQGEGGFITPPDDYFRKLKSICDSYGILLIIDEVQSGFGRTGKLFAIDHWGIEPEMITMAKSMAAGIPLSAVTGRKEIMNKPHPGGLGGTTTGTPLGCRAALAVIDIMAADGFLPNAVNLGEKLKNRFDAFREKYEIIGEVRGKGPMLALELVKDRETRKPATEETQTVVQRCRENGLIMIACGRYSNVLRTLMPLVITDEQLEKGLEILEEQISAVC